jgi:Galactose oxidase, central domain
MAIRKSTLLVPALIAMFCLLAPVAGSGELPDGQWVKVDTGGGCNRRSSAVVWLGKEKKFLVVGGMRGGPKVDFPRITYALQTYDPATRKWENRFPRGKEKEWTDAKGNSIAPRHPGSSNYAVLKDSKGNIRLRRSLNVASYFAFDPEAECLYVALAGHGLQRDLRGKTLPILRYKVAERTWEMIDFAGPPVKPIYGPLKMTDSRIVMDPVSKELLFIGGMGSGVGAEGGTVGSWAFSIEKKTWRRLISKSDLLDPLFAKATSGVRPARDGMAAARNIFYAGMTSAAESKAVKDKPAKLVAEALKLAEVVSGALQSTVAKSWEKEAVARARILATRAVADLKAAHQGFSAGKLDAVLLKRVFDASWALDRAADCLRSSPAPRKAAAAAYDQASKTVVLFGGDHLDYVMNDTWLYECKTQKWRQVWPKTAPSPRASADMLWLPGRKQLALVGGMTFNTKFTYYRTHKRIPTEIWTFDTARIAWSLVSREESKAKIAFGKSSPTPDNLTSALTAGDGDVLIGLAWQTMGSRKMQWAHEFTTWLQRVPAKGAAGLTEKYGVASGRRTYTSVVSGYDPCWYDAAPRGDRGKTEAWLTGLKPNTWVGPPKSPRPCPESEWGTSAYDPQRDALYLWTGGHMSDPSSLVATYHPGINRWSIPYVADRGFKGRSFTNRPDAANHTYLNYTYDPLSQRLVACSVGGIGVYNPELRDWEYMGPQVWPCKSPNYYAKLRGTSRGVVFWAPGCFHLFDVAKKTWTKLPVKGAKLPGRINADDNAIVWDTRRDALYLLSVHDEKGQIWRYDMKSGESVKLSPRHYKSFGARWKNGLREAVYLPKLDLVLFNNFIDKQQVAYDPAKNRWVRLNIAPVGKRIGHQSNANLAYDSRRGLVWALCGGKEMRVLRIDPKALKITEGAPTTPAKKK